MKMHINKWIGVLVLLFLAACTDDNTPFAEVEPNSQGVRLLLAPQEMPLVAVRSGDLESRADSRIDHVIIYAFDPSGNLLQKYQQDLEHPDREVRPLLPKETSLKIHAVCNYPQLWDENVENESALENKMITIEHADATFNGAMVMHGDVVLEEGDLTEKNNVNKISVTRIAARVTLDLSFNPEIPSDEFYLTSIRLCNIPNRSWLKLRPQVNNDTIPRAVGDATYTEKTDDTQQKNFYFTETLLPHTTDDQGHSHVEAYLFENRWGCEPNDDRYTKKFATRTCGKR